MRGTANPTSPPVTCDSREMLLVLLLLPEVAMPVRPTDTTSSFTSLLIRADSHALTVCPGTAQMIDEQLIGPSIKSHNIRTDGVYVCGGNR
jgi:hypothetical protein